MPRLTEDEQERAGRCLRLAIWALHRGGWPRTYDNLQTAYLELCKAISVHDPLKGKLSTLVYAYVRNAMCREHTGRRAEFERGLESGLDLDAVAVEHREADLDAAELAAEAMRLLNERQRGIVEARLLDGLTLEQVGRRLNLCRERVRQIEARAIGKVRARMGRKAG